MLQNAGVFYIIDLEMRFVPQRRAIFHIGTSKIGPSLRCFVHFDLQMSSAPQRSAIFHLSAEQLHLRARRFSEPTFRTSGTTNNWKNMKKHSDSRRP